VLYFFLSYAREDDPEFIRRFFRDLSGQVRNLAGAGIEETVGFLDEQNVQIGQRWSNELTDALATCGCLIAMLSPRYFRRDYCGREWWLFTDRLASYERRWNRAVPALLPVRWIPMSRMHPLAAEIQSANAGLGGSTYLEYGLRQMLDVKRFRDDYRTFAFDLARRIVLLADTHKIPHKRGHVRLDKVPNIFSIEPDNVRVSRDKTSAERVSVRDARGRPTRTFVHFVVLAGTREEMSTIRTGLDYYGLAREDWAPFRPGLDETLAHFATEVAGDRLFDSEVGDVTMMAERIEQAKHRNEVVVLLIDVWSLLLADHHRALSDYDTSDDLTAAVMIPFNSSDAETLADTTVLHAPLAQVLRRNLERRDRTMLRQNIPTPEQFGTDLEKILEVAQNRIFKVGTVNPEISDWPAEPRPILKGPPSTLDANDS
jgi:FxsC-like protein